MHRIPTVMIATLASALLLGACSDAGDGSSAGEVESTDPTGATTDTAQPATGGGVATATEPGDDSDGSRSQEDADGTEEDSDGTEVADGADATGEPVAEGSARGADRVTICHRTNGSSPWVEITISESAIPAHENHPWGADIIPAPDDGCPTEPTTPPTTTPPTTTPPTEPTTPPTSAPPTSAPPTSAPPTSAPATTAPATTAPPTTAPPTTPTTPPTGPTVPPTEPTVAPTTTPPTSVPPEVLPPGTTTTTTDGGVSPSTNPPDGGQPSTSVSGGGGSRPDGGFPDDTLPETGGSNGLLVLLGLAALAAGGAARRISRRV